MYDLLIANGTVVDPEHGQRRLDVALRWGRIARLEASIPPDQCRQVLDATGCLVAPGLIDLHVHVYPGVSHYGIEPDATCLAHGATTVCDAGSAGADTFEGLRRYVIDVSETRVFAFLNISAIGMVSALNNELEDLRHASPERAIAVCERHRDVIQGIKVRLSRSMVGKNGLEPLRLAKRAAEAVGMPIMIHIGDTPDPLGEILQELRPRDIVTHCFHGRRHGILSEAGEIRPEVKRAADRGVVFDVGHGVGSFSFEVARKALAQGFLPGTISSDLHYYNVHGPVYDLATTMSKFMHLGLSLEDVLARTTTTPASLLGIADRLGAVREGFLADLVVLKLHEAVHEFEDSMQQRVTGSRWLEPLAVVRGGRVYASRIRLGMKPNGDRF